MNEEDVRLLQAAAGFGEDVNESMPTVVGDVVAEQLSIDDLSVEQISHALQSLADTMGGEVGVEEISQDLKQRSQQPSPPPPPPPPEGSLSSLNTTTATTTNNNSEFGFNANLNTTRDIGELWGIRGGQNGDSVTGGRGMEDGSDIDYEVQLADLQRSLAELSHPATRANTPPPTKSSMEQNQMSSELATRAGQDRQMIATEQSVQFAASWIFTNLQSSNNYSATPSPGATEPNGKNRSRQFSIIDPSDDPLKAAEKERIRVENRERKKKWRNQNQERNKDNDLRCRVTKRALHLYGPDMSTEKSNWIEREFNRRRSKRVTRTKPRGADPTGSDPNGSSSVFPAFNQSIPRLPPNFLSNSGEVVLRDQLTNALNNPMNIEINSEFVIIELVALLSTQPALLPYLVDILNQMKADARMSGMIQNGSNQTVQGFDNRITDVSNQIGNNVENNIDRHEAELGLIENGSNAGWTTGSATPVPKRSEDVSTDRVGFESIDKIAAGFENLVASLEKSLRNGPVITAGQDGTNGTPPPQPENGNDQVKPEPVSPKLAAPVDGPSGVVPLLAELPLDIDFGHKSIPGPDSLDQALEELMREQYEATTVSEEGEGDVQFDEEALERLITEGGIDVAEFMESMESESTEAQQGQLNGISDFTESTDTDDRRELAQQLRHAGHTPAPPASKSPQLSLEDDDIPLVATSRMSLEEINSLIADLDDGSDLMPIQLGGQSQVPQQVAHPPPPPLPASSPPSFNPDPDTSALYTPENVVAILKTLLEMTVVPENAPVSPPPAYNTQRGTKRSSPDSSLNPSPTKRQRAQTPNGGASGMAAATKTAINQLNGLLLSNGYHANSIHSYGSNQHSHSPPSHNSPPTTSPNGNIQTPAYVASFGTTDGMNKRLMVMKPPPYRPAGTVTTGSGTGGNSGVASKKKTGEEEKKVRAMGFPPLMAGLKPKSG